MRHLPSEMRGFKPYKDTTLDKLYIIYKGCRDDLPIQKPIAPTYRPNDTSHETKLESTNSTNSCHRTFKRDKYLWCTLRPKEFAGLPDLANCCLPVQIVHQLQSKVCVEAQFCDVHSPRTATSVQQLTWLASSAFTPSLPLYRSGTSTR